jgi:hypothetical protein
MSGLQPFLRGQEENRKDESPQAGLSAEDPAC